jgi:hypothetical protein
MHQQTKFCSLTTSTYGVMDKNVFSHFTPWWKKDGSWIEILRVFQLNPFNGLDRYA